MNTEKQMKGWEVLLALFAVGIVGLFAWLIWSAGYSQAQSDALTASIASSTATLQGDLANTPAGTLYLAAPVNTEDENQDDEILELTDRLDALDGGKTYYWSCPNVIGTSVITQGKETVKQLYGYTGCTIEPDYGHLLSPITITP